MNKYDPELIKIVYKYKQNKTLDLNNFLFGLSMSGMSTENLVFIKLLIKNLLELTLDKNITNVKVNSVQ